jgi:hypothetical protein
LHCLALPCTALHCLTNLIRDHPRQSVVAFPIFDAANTAPPSLR